MKKQLLMVLCAAVSCSWASAQGNVSSQIKGDFDIQNTWEKTDGIYPEGWYASNVDRVLKFPIVFGDADRTTTGGKSIKMVNDFCGAMGLGANAPAFVSLGEFWSYAWCKLVLFGSGSKILASDGGTHGGVEFTSQPDSIVGYIKRQHGVDTGKKEGEQNLNEKAQILAYFRTGTTKSQVKSGLSLKEKEDVEPQEMVDRDKDVLGMITEGVTKSEDFSLVATVDKFIEGDYEDWTYVSLPVNYLTDGVPEKANVIISSAEYFNDKTIGKGNTLWADDFKFIYNSKLKSITINGTPLEGFNKDTYMYVLQGEFPAKDDIVAISDGKGAKVDIQEGDNIMKIVVTGNDGASNQHVYSLVRKGTTFGATAIALNDVKLEDFDPAVTSYDGLEMTNGVYPVVSVNSDPNLTSVDMQLSTSEHTVTIVVTDKVNGADHTYTLKFTPSDKIMNGSQIKGDFEKQVQWGPDALNEERWGTVADGWYSSNVTQMGSMNFVMVEKESHVVGDDKLAVKMINGRPGAMGIESNAPGYIALGRPWVYADMIGLMSSIYPGGIPDTDDSDGGTIGGVNFSYQPDSIIGYYKRTYADAGSKLAGTNLNEEAKIIAYLWKGTSTSMAPATGDLFTSTGSSWQLLIDRDIDILGTKNGGEAAGGITLIASAEETVKELADWTRISVPLNYVSDEKPEKANVIISSADYFNRTRIGNGNTLSADNVAFVYNSKLKSITISGTALTGFDKDTYEYAVDGVMPVVADVVAEADGKGATVEVTAAGKVLTITVKGNDIADNAANYHTYTLTFKGGVGVEQNTYNSLSIKGIESGVVVEGAQLEELIEVYSVQGMLVAQSTVNGTMTIHGLSSNTIYLVKIGSYVTRVMTK